METKHPSAFAPAVGNLYDLVYNDAEIREFIQLADEAMAAIGFTEHGMRHVVQVADTAGHILAALGHPDEEVQLARCAGFMHDIGNLVGREDHTRSGALLAYAILNRLGFAARQVGLIMGAIGSHEEEVEPPLNAICAAVIIADKVDVHRTRVRKYNPDIHDIHDDVNFACVESNLKVEKEAKLITLEMTIDLTIATVMEYFQIFNARMMITRIASEYLGCAFHIVVNGTKIA
jgi:metal-dependent HD superfamily phosphatase/phosphodiesterase